MLSRGRDARQNLADGLRLPVGKVQEALQLFQQATVLNPNNKANLKQVARCLFLLGKHKAAIDVYEEAARIAGGSDWEATHNMGLCYMYMQSYEQ